MAEWKGWTVGGVGLSIQPDETGQPMLMLHRGPNQSEVVAAFRDEETAVEVMEWLDLSLTATGDINRQLLESMEQHQRLLDELDRLRSSDQAGTM